DDPGTRLSAERASTSWKTTPANSGVRTVRRSPSSPGSVCSAPTPCSPTCCPFHRIAVFEHKFERRAIGFPMKGVGTIGGVPPQPHSVEGRRRGLARDLVDDAPTDVFPAVTGPRPSVTPAQAEPEQAHGSPRSESGRSHGHGHGHTPAPPAGRRVRILLAALLAPAAVAALVGLVLLWPAGPAPTSQAATATPVHAQVIETRAAPCDDAAVGAGGGPGAPIGAGGNQPGGDGAGSA